MAAEKLGSKACYVATSRGRESATVHTIEKDRLYSGLPQSEDRLSVSDVLQSLKRPDKYKVVDDYYRELDRRSLGQSHPISVSAHREHAPEQQKQQGKSIGF